MINQYVAVGILTGENMLCFIQKNPDFIKNNPEIIISQITNHMNIEFEQLISKSRKRELVYCRALIYYYLKHFKYGSLAKIGELFNNRDHATVLHGINTVKNFLEIKDDYFKDNIKYFNEFYKITKEKKEEQCNLN